MHLWSTSLTEAFLFADIAWDGAPTNGLLAAMEANFQEQGSLNKRKGKGYWEFIAEDLQKPGFKMPFRVSYSMLVPHFHDHGCIAYCSENKFQ